MISFSPVAIGPGGAHSSHEPAGPLTPRKPEPALTPRSPGPLHPTRQGPSPSANPWWASRPRHVSFRGIMPLAAEAPG